MLGRTLSHFEIPETLGQGGTDPVLWQMPTNGGDETKVVNGTVSAGWTVAGRYIYFLNPGGTPPAVDVTLERLDPKTGNRKTLMSMPRGTHIFMLAISSDEERSPVRT